MKQECHKCMFLDRYWASIISSRIVNSWDSSHKTPLQIEQSHYQAYHNHVEFHLATNNSSPSTMVSTTSTFEMHSPSTRLLPLNAGWATSAKPGSSNFEVVPASTIPRIPRRGIVLPNDRQLVTLTSTPAAISKAAPAALADEKEPSEVSRKWKIVAMTLAVILAAILFLGLIVLLSCGWLILYLLDRHEI
jgi:hypothetical protein